MALKYSSIIALKSLKGPGIFFTNLGFFLGCEIVDDVEELPNKLHALILDEVCNDLSQDIQEGFHVEVVGSEDQFENLVHAQRLHELFVESSSFELEDSTESITGDVGERNGDGSFVVVVLNEGLYRHHLLHDRGFHLEDDFI